MESPLPSSPPPSVHDYIDHIFFINLEKRKDRLEQIIAEFENVGIEKYERFNGIPVEEMGILGCGLSHMSVLKIAKERGYKNVLIVEDDFRFVLDKEEFLKEIRQIFENAVDFDAIMFAYGDPEFVEDWNEHSFLMKLKRSQNASCYMVAGHYYDALIELYEWAMPLLKETGMHWEYANDVIWKQLMVKDKWYATKRRVGFQRMSFSDTSKQIMVER